MREPRYVIGDIHGCYAVLRTLVRTVPIRDDETIVLLGDYVDRGPNSRKVLEWVRQRTRRGHCIPLRGNHEVMMHSALTGKLSVEHWEMSGGRETIASYFSKKKAKLSNRPPLTELIPQEHQEFLVSGLYPYWETETHIFVHGGLIETAPLRAQDEYSLYWERFDRLQPHFSGKTIICGHTAQKSGVPNDKGFAVCIDTRIYPDGWLTCLDVETGKYWQANRNGRTRTGKLSSPKRS